MSFVWTREANNLLTQIYLTQPVVTKDDLNEVIDKIKVSLAVVQSEKETESSEFITTNLSEIPPEEILMRLAILPECPQPVYIKIDWSRKLRNTCMNDYLIQFWEFETQCRIDEDLDVKFVPDWSKFNKSIHLLYSVDNVNISQGEGEEDIFVNVIPWAHTCQERIEDIRRAFLGKFVQRKRPIHTRSKTLCVNNQSTEKWKKMAPPKATLIHTKTNHKKNPIMGSRMWDEEIEATEKKKLRSYSNGNPPRPLHFNTSQSSVKTQNSHKHLETDQGKIRSQSPGKSPSRQNSQKPLTRSSPGKKSISRQNSQKHFETDQGKIRSQSPGKKSLSRQNSQKHFESDQGKIRSQSPGKSPSRQSSQKQLETRSQSPAKSSSRQSSQKQLETRSQSPAKSPSRQSSQKQLETRSQSPAKSSSRQNLLFQFGFEVETDQGKFRSQGHGKTPSRQNSQKHLETDQGKIRSQSPGKSRQNSPQLLQITPRKKDTELGSSTQSSPTQSPGISKSRSQGPSPSFRRTKTDGMEDRYRNLRWSKKRIQKESFKRREEKFEMSSQSPSPVQELELGWGGEDSYLDYDNALSHASSEI